MKASRIYLTGRIEGGIIYWNIAPLPVDDEPADAELQRLIDEGEQTQELIDWLEDEEWIRRGC